MNVTAYNDVNSLLSELLTSLKDILGEKLTGLYLEGSLVLGDFEPGISDIDLIAVLSSEVNNQEFEELHKMHNAFVIKHKEWNDRIEVCYLTADAINTTKTKVSNIVNISPGEPFHKTKTRKEWLINWYLLQEKGKTLYGPPPSAFINPISNEEFVQSVKDHAISWKDWVKEMRNPYAQSYAILAMCRALYAFKNSDQVSKKQAAMWVMKKLPQWTKLIQNALAWRKEGKYRQADNITHPETVQFVHYIRGLILE